MIKKLLFLVGFIILLCLFALPAYSDKINPIWNLGPVFFGRPTGEIGFRFRSETLDEEYETETQRNYRLFNEELTINEKLFVYHPRFLSLDVLAGFKLGQGYVDYQGGDILTNFGLRGNVLSGTPYSGQFYFYKRRMDIEHIPSREYLSNQTQGGTRFRLSEEIIGWPINLKFDYLSSNAENIFSSDNQDFNINETWETLELDTQKKWGAFDLDLRSRTIFYDRIFEIDDKETKISWVDQYFSGILRGKFLADEELRTISRFNADIRTGFPKYSNFNFNQEARYRFFSDKLQELEGFADFDISKRIREPSETQREFSESTWFQQDETKAQIHGGISHSLGESLDSSLEGRLEKRWFTSYEEFISEIMGNTDYTKKIPLNGRVFGGYGFSFNNSNREGEETSFVANEMHKISDYAAVTLEGEEISTESVTVTDVSGTITYAEGLDYRIYRIERFTYIERVPGGHILNGDTILVNYSHLALLGDIRDITQTISGGISLFDGLIEPYFRLSDTRQGVTGGTGNYADLLISPGQSRIIGIRSSHTLKNFWNIERFSSAEFEDNTKILYPFRRLTLRSSLAVPINKDLKLVFRGNNSRINYLKSNQNDINFLSLGADLVYDIQRIRFFGGVNY